MEITEKFKDDIAPFYWVDDDESPSVCLEAGEYLQEMFESRADEGFEGNGYDWESLAIVYLEENASDLEDIIEFDPEAGMFCAYSEDANALQEFIIGFKNACEDKNLIMELFSRAEVN